VRWKEGDKSFATIPLTTSDSKSANHRTAACEAASSQELGNHPGACAAPGTPWAALVSIIFVFRDPNLPLGGSEGGPSVLGGGVSGPLLQGCCCAYRPSLLVGLHRAQRCHDSCRATRSEWWVCRDTWGGDGDDRRRRGRCPAVGRWRKLQEQTAPFQCCCKHDKPIIDALKTHT
jgi:hypothetical protein